MRMRSQDVPDGPHRRELTRASHPQGSARVQRLEGVKAQELGWGAPSGLSHPPVCAHSGNGTPGLGGTEQAGWLGHPRLPVMVCGTPGAASPPARLCQGRPSNQDYVWRTPVAQQSCGMTDKYRVQRAARLEPKTVERGAGPGHQPLSEPRLRPFPIVYKSQSLGLSTPRCPSL